ncbi:ion channel [Crenobacter sp. SG2303]|uniref:Ion channel n=1 Tax=Crenobacter oryzisoli TaxID=3056844 RepID=A0ABT7XHZ7_9NEIS|nr:potassium channel family protein [Crenobacter sp. SG2303]MDN0073393.1 ion channel [Crenobacter sp. SG2303]
MQTFYDRLDRLQHCRYQLLFVLLLLALVQSPLVRLLGMDSIEARIAGVFLVLVLLVVVIGELSVRRGHHFWVGGSVAGLLWLGIWLGGYHRVIEIGYLLWGTLSWWAVVRILPSVWQSGRVDRERIFAALSVYLLFGIGCGAFYFALDKLDPSSLLISAGQGPQSVDFFSAQYFSFVSLTTMGFGDIVATSRSARGLVMFEAVSGQMYLAVLVARLVGLFGSEIVARQERRGPVLKLRDRRRRLLPHKDGGSAP